MNLTAEQVLALAPDPSSASAARKLGVAKPWKSLGRSERAMWGECQGSALYQVRVDLTDMTTKCSCPSRKFPCKHALGLLLVAATSAAPFATAEHPEWVGDWLGKRAATAERKEGRAAAPEKAPDPAAQAKRAEQRLARVTKGLDALDIWLSDLMRNGLAGVESQPHTYWEAQAARLVDAQAPALASRVRRLAHLSRGDARWPARLLDELGRIALLTHAFRRIDALPPALQADVRQLIGWSLTLEEVAASGEAMATSVVYSSIFGAVLASLRAVTTRMVVFDTAVADLTDELDDPVDLLFGTQLGGGTDINLALSYCQQIITRPAQTILVLITDLYEGGNAQEMVKRADAIVQSGVNVVCLLALSDQGAPTYDQSHAAQFAALGIPSFACTPDMFPDLMAAAIQRRDLSAWAARNDIVAARR